LGFSTFAVWRDRTKPRRFPELDGKSLMTLHRSRRRAAYFLATSLATTGLAVGLEGAAAESKSVEMPAYRALGASESMSAPGHNGDDYSTNPPSLAGLTLLATIAAPPIPRLGYFIQAQCAAGLTVVFDDEAGSTIPTEVVLAGPAVDGGQGGSLSMAGMPHTGRIRIYSSSAGCQMAARSW
jgi:hypothetical protein